MCSSKLKQKFSMFKFDFFVESENCENPFNDAPKEEETNANEIENDKNKTTNIPCYDSEEVEQSEDILDRFDIYQLNAIEKHYKNVTISYAVCGNLLTDVINKEENNIENDIAKSELNHSDLLPGVYEGGAKIWECTNDLLEYLDRQYMPDDFKNKRVLDLGCGAGLVGIYAFKCGSEVYFQDYNTDVLSNITIPNVLLNIEMDAEMKDAEIKEQLRSVKYYSGDWKKFSQLTKDANKFDLILSSETIYNPENQQKLIDTFAEKLKDEGKVLVAGKSHYFGVGGGMRQFETLIAQDERFISKVVYSTQEAGLIREILMLQRKALKL